MGAAALAGVFYTVLFMIGFGFSLGGQILIGKFNGENRDEKRCHSGFGRDKRSVFPHI